MRWGIVSWLTSNTNQPLQSWGENRDSHPYSANACDSLAEAYLQAGNKNEAIRWYSKALEIDPKFDNSRRMLEQLGKTK